MSKSLKSQLLIAVPNLPDSNFFRSVVLMIQHDDEGAFGVVLNRPSDLTIADVWEKISEQPSERAEHINLGGPVQGPIIALHTDDACAETEVLPGVYVATDRDHLNHLVRQTDQPLRLFIGYSGWAGGQLESELDAGGWLTTPAKQKFIFHHDADLWKTVANEIGQDALYSHLKISNSPSDPSLN